MPTSGLNSAVPEDLPDNRGMDPREPEAAPDGKSDAEAAVGPLTKEDIPPAETNTGAGAETNATAEAETNTATGAEINATAGAETNTGAGAETNATAEAGSRGGGSGQDRRLRQPIVAVLGHVDHGKTTLLDFIRSSNVVAKEAGAITQHIGATEVPINLINQICGELLKNVEVQLPGLLFIDTPGHHSFTTLRARGGALADLAIVILDINEGFKPQTLESINILRQSRTPFVVALTKLDRIMGWKSRPGCFTDNLPRQSKRTRTYFDERFYKIVGEFAEQGFQAELYTQVIDFTRSLALVPVCARETGEGLPDLLMVLMGLAQRYLRDRLHLNPGPAEGTVIEVTEERGLGKTLNVIIFNGLLRIADTIVVGATPDPIVSRVKTILQPRPLDLKRDPREPFLKVEEVGAAAGVKLVAPHLEGVLSGVPLYGVHPGEDIADTLVKMAEQMRPNVELDEQGVVIKADAVGSLEALAYELQAANVKIISATVGEVAHRDVAKALAASKLDRVILSFNTKVLPDARRELEHSNVRLFESDVVYRIVEDYLAWHKQEVETAEAALRESVEYPGKFMLLPDHTFRQKDPAVVGVRVLAGRLVVGQKVLKADGRVVGRIRSMRSGEEALKEAKQGDEVAVAITQVTVGRQIHEEEVLFIDLKAHDARKLFSGRIKLHPDEEDTLHEVAKIKRQIEGPFWGR